MLVSGSFLLVCMVWPVSGSRGSAHSNALFALLLLVPALIAGPPADPDPLTLRVELPGVQDQVELVSHDPRPLALANTAPDAARGLYTGTLATQGWPLHLVYTDDVNLGVLAAPTGGQWVTVESGTLVPFQVQQMPIEPTGVPGHLDAEATEAGPVPAVPVSSQDGVLQIRLDGDQWFHSQYQGQWREVQLMVTHLVSGIYVANLGFPIEVVDQHVWTHDGPQPWGEADQLCQGGAQDPLRLFRSHWESALPITQNEHEAGHLFSGKRFAGNTIGCAYIRQLETSAAYGVSQVRGPVQNPQLYQAVVLVSHELGHNFNGIHSLAIGPGCTGGTIMWPTLCQNSPVFSGAESLAACRAGLSSCSLVSTGNAQRMHGYATERL